MPRPTATRQSALVLGAAVLLGLFALWAGFATLGGAAGERDTLEAAPSGEEPRSVRLEAAPERPGDGRLALARGDGAPSARGTGSTGAAAPESAPVRLRFVRGTTGRPAADLRVRVFDAPADGAELERAATAAPLAEGRTDAHGFIVAPPDLRGRDFLLDVEEAGGEAGDGSFAEPNLIAREHLPSGDEVFEIRVFGPWARIEARVVDSAGNPAPGAIVQFDFESPALAFSTRDASSTRVATDAQGLARLELFDPASAGGRLRLRAEAPGELRSPAVELAPPLASTEVELRLAASALAVVRVAGSTGAPRAGAMARLELLDPPYTSLGRSTDRDGTARFSPLEPGRYAASAEDPATGTRARVEFTLARCQVSELALELPPSELPLAVAGTVRDSQGRPVEWLWVSICVDGREEARLAPDADGRFAYHRAPCARLRVRLRTAFDGPRVEPEVVDAPFGARDLAFVVGETPTVGSVALRVVDRASGEALAGVRAVLYQDSAAERIGGFVSTLAGSPLSLAANDAGWLVVPSGPQLPRAHLVVEKRGYVRRELEVADLARLPLRDGQPVLELARGFERRWLVLDARTLAPIAGAVAVADGDPFGAGRTPGSSWPFEASLPSDARGILELALPRVPERVSIQARGYATFSIETLVTGAIGGDAVLLERER